MKTLSLLLAMSALFLAAAAWSADEHLTELEKRGKLVYTSGESASGRPITAVVSRGATPIPASILPCSGCHGDDGAGRPEGGVVPRTSVGLRWSPVMDTSIPMAVRTPRTTRTALLHPSSRASIRQAMNSTWRCRVTRCRRTIWERCSRISNVSQLITILV